MTGKIMKGIGGFYYVYVEGSGLYECRARGIFRNKKMKPNVGDVVDIDILSEEEKTGNLVKIHKRKNQLIRPMAANVDQALVIFAVHEPEPNFHLLNRFLITMEQQEIPVSFLLNSPFPRILTPSKVFFTKPLSIKVSIVTTLSASNLSSSETLIAMIFFELMQVKPLLGSLLYNGI